MEVRLVRIAHIRSSAGRIDKMSVIKCDINGITLDNSNIAIADSGSDWIITTGNINDRYWCKTIAEKHFNCPFCGAPNQIDVCEYCGSTYEE